MSRNTILIFGAHPAAPHRPQHLNPAGGRAGQGRRRPASAASGTLDAAEPGTIVEAMGDVRILRSATPTAVIFTLNQDTLTEDPFS
jgi:hypothetical protein